MKQRKSVSILNLNINRKNKLDNDHKNSNIVEEVEGNVTKQIMIFKYLVVIVKAARK